MRDDCYLVQIAWISLPITLTSTNIQFNIDCGEGSDMARNLVRYCEKLTEIMALEKPVEIWKFIQQIREKSRNP